MFDSPIARCEIVGEMVLIDETQAECAHEHDCPPGRVCPLLRYFASPDMRYCADPPLEVAQLH